MDKFTQDEMIDTLCALMINVRINSYAAERVAFGYNKPGDEVSVDDYLEELDLPPTALSPERREIAGVFIDESGRISSDFTTEEYMNEVFYTSMGKIFIDAPRDPLMEEIDDELPFYPVLRNYLCKLLSIFKEILQMSPHALEVEAISMNVNVERFEVPKWQHLMCELVLNDVKAGECIDGYISDINVPELPYYIGLLITRRDGHYYLVNADKDDYVFIFALFSAISFCNSKYSDILKRKMDSWYQTINS